MEARLAGGGLPAAEVIIHIDPISVVADEPTPEYPPEEPAEAGQSLLNKLLFSTRFNTLPAGLRGMASMKIISWAACSATVFRRSRR